MKKIRTYKGRVKEKYMVKTLKKLGPILKKGILGRFEDP